MTQTTDIHAAIRAADDEFEAAFAKSDSARLSNLYTDEALGMPTGAESAKGKAAIAAFWQGAMDMGIKSAKLDIQELEQQYKVDLLDKMNVSFKQGDFIAYKNLKDFRQMIKNRSVSAKTIVFNNLVSNIAEFNENWEVPASESWHSRFFK